MEKILECESKDESSNLSRTSNIINAMKTNSFFVVYYNNGELKKYDIIPYLVDKYESLSRKNRPNLRLYNSVKEFIVKECRYQFWSRCEYEIIISSWPNEINKKKIDVYDQIVLNIDIITKILTSYLTMLGY